MSFKKIIRNTSYTSIGIFISRILGVVRDIFIANFFGASFILESFLVAFRLPNVFRSILGEGFSDIVVLPVLAEYKNNRERMYELARRLIVILSVVLFVVSALGVLLSRYMVFIIAPGFVADIEKFNLAVLFTRLMFFYLFFIGIASTLNAVLNSVKRFFVPAISGAILNLSFIIGILFFHKSLENWILVICVMTAGVLQMLLPLCFLRKQIIRGMARDSKGIFKDPDIRRISKLFIPRIWGSAIYQLSVFVDTVLCSFTMIVGPGAIAFIHYVNRFVQLPLAFIAVAISRVTMVDLSFYHKEDDLDKFKELLIFSVENVIFMVLPVTVFYIVFSKLIISVVFEHGAFSALYTAITAKVLISYSFGILFFCLIKIFVNAFYSLKDTMTPVKTSLVSLVFNIVLSGILIFVMGVSGVAVGSSIAALLNCYLLYKCLKIKIGSLDTGYIVYRFTKIFFLSIVAVLIPKFISIFLPANRYWLLVLVLLQISILFFAGGLLLRIKQVEYLKKWLMKRLKR
ncbi:MAG: murein biosynthesis integral membrane protein MurJ [Candidatus Omnitrophica bacterium]|nr:murein biosynthesis integral membrane protein MurJ [Candidatus Omnitrophota bacterium]MDD5081517.1 murein biosynthesis integral membrane protein MurJ [Candidatus Omnitrophota bacterium]MDD5441447.1 murein biosynthesis integral membrane protein MurJ [Candidatus Omnitrophota bacterium]